ncbi:MAG TPA: STAS domain-containing protein [Ilumatobacteraceae bacterium]
MFDQDGRTVVAVTGEVDMHSAGLLDEALGRVQAGGHARLDLGDVRFIDSSGLRVIMMHATRLSESDGSLEVSEVSSFVKRVADIAGVGDLVRRSHLAASDGPRV